MTTPQAPLSTPLQTPFSTPIPSPFTHTVPPFGLSHGRWTQVEDWGWTYLAPAGLFSCAVVVVALFMLSVQNRA